KCRECQNPVIRGSAIRGRVQRQVEVSHRRTGGHQLNREAIRLSKGQCEVCARSCRGNSRQVQQCGREREYAKICHCMSSLYQTRIGFKDPITEVSGIERFCEEDVTVRNRCANHPCGVCDLRPTTDDIDSELLLAWVFNLRRSRALQVNRAYCAATYYIAAIENVRDRAGSS